MPTPTGWRGLWDARRVRLWLGAAIVAAWLPLLGMPLRGWLDFSAFYAAGTLAFTPDLMDLGAIVGFQTANDLPITPWVYPPGLALLYVPFSWLPYGIAAPLHVLAEASLLGLAAWVGAPLVGIARRWAVVGTFAWAPAAAGVVSGQNVALGLLLVVLGAWAMVHGRPWLAGVVVGLLAYKPQLALPQAGTLLWRGVWPAVVAFAAIVGVHYVLGVVATGGSWAWPSDWLTILATYSGPDFEANGWQAISLPALGGHVAAILGGAEASGAFSLPAVVGVAVGIVYVIASLRALRAWAVVAALALAAAVGLVISPHAWIYDATLLLPAVGIFAVAAGRRGWPWQDRWLLAAAYGVVLLWPLGGFIGVATPIVVVLLAPAVLLGWGPLRRFGAMGPVDGAG
ncbi:MAG TPA: glycosyltransferase family 87 protein [Candidatus Limnocylindrales bacterium]